MLGLKKQIQKIYKFILDILFPIRCLGCGKEGNWICDDCLATIELIKNPTCPKCGKPSKYGKFCAECSFKSRMTGIMVAASYDNKLLQKSIHTMKYKFVKDLAKPLSKILVKTLNSNLLDSQILTNKIICIPVPLHTKRLKWRGFNQAQELSYWLNNQLKIPIRQDILVRSKHTQPQMQIKSHLVRRKNIKNAFQCANPKAVKDKTIILIDDVCTTSATLEECAKALYKAKPKEIWGLVLARV